MKALESIWTPTQKQAIAMSCPAYELMYGGAKGGAKSEFLIFDHVNQHQLAHRHWEVTRMKTTTAALIMRKEFGRLRDLIQRSHTYYPILSEGAMEWKESEHTWYCACGYRVWFGHCEGPQDHELYHGQEIGYFGLDQGEELPYHQYAYIKLQVRTSQKHLEPTLAVRVTANPGGKYGAWVKKRFVDPCRAGMMPIAESVEIDRGGVKTVVTKERIFIPSFLWDNPHLSVGYEAELRLAPEHMRRAFLDGDWDVVEGSFFGDVFDATIHVIDDLGPTEIRIPSNWPVFRCADWGSRNPAACYWITVDNDGLLVVLDELYGPGQTPDHWARRVLELEEKWGWTEKPRGYDDKRVSVSKLTGVLDPSCFKDDVSGGPKISTQLFEAGLVFYEGDNERKPGWVELRRRLMERGGASKKIPGIRITRRCANLIRTLPNLTSGDPDKGGDMDDISTKQEDHACLVAGTMIRLADGSQVPIEAVSVTAQIQTPEGPRALEAWAKTSSDAECYRLSLDDGREIVGTGNHPIFLGDGTQKRLDALRYGDRVSVWRQPRQSNSTASLSAGTLNQSASKTGAISSHQARMSSEALNHSTGRFGSISEAQSRQAFMCITWTGTHRITTFQTYPQFLGENTLAGMQAGYQDHYQGQPSAQRQNGILHQQGSNGIENTANALGLGALQQQGNAGNVATNSATVQDMQSFADQIARPRTSAVVTVEPAGRHAVYNITVAGAHSYYANGILTHNCDAIRYGVMSRPRGRVESEMDESELKNWERVMLRQAQASSTNGRNQTTGY